MKLRGREKHFWLSNFSIKSLNDIPKEMDRFSSIDFEHDDEFLFFLTSRVPVIREIYLKSSLVTDQGVGYIVNIQNITQLTLRDHRKITKRCLPDINKLTELEYLDISKTEIALDDLSVLSNLKNLKELYVSSENTNEEYISSKLSSLKEMLPNCIVHIDSG